MSTTEDDLFLMRLLEAWEAHARIIQERANQLYSWTSNTTRRLEQKHLARETVESSRNHLARSRRLLALSARTLDRYRLR